MEFDGIVGTSIGALNAAFIIQGDYDIMEDIWLNQDYKSFMIIEEDLYENIKILNLK
ncbi:MAG: patatin-like phospholipase family protein [Intestinibacter sp.]